MVGTIANQLPESWTTHVRYQWRHGTDAYALPFVRKDGLAPSTHGAGMVLGQGQTPWLYTIQSKNTALYCTRPRTLPLETFQDCGVFG
eukprot:9568166-Karenia_brevis.AAC.1